MNEIFARRLKAEREAKGWTQAFLADLIGVSNGTISGYERNYREPDIAIISQLAESFEVSVDYLLGKTNRRNFESFKVAESKSEYSTGNDYEQDLSWRDLPQEAQQAIEDFISFIKEKYRPKK